MSFCRTPESAARCGPHPPHPSRYATGAINGLIKALRKVGCCTCGKICCD